jgi:hypothetical protein
MCPIIASTSGRNAVRLVMARLHLLIQVRTAKLQWLIIFYQMNLNVFKIVRERYLKCNLILKVMLLLQLKLH